MADDASPAEGDGGPTGSLARHLLCRLLPALVVLMALDVAATWWVTRQADAREWLAHELFWMMVLCQLMLVVGCAWVLVAGVRSGLASVRQVAEDMRERAVDDLTPLRTDGLPREVLPLVLHFNDMLQRLDASIQAQQRFVGQAAHQLRTPLTGLRLELELMLASELPGEVRARAERINRVTNRMIRLGQQLLVLARVDASARPQDSFIRLDLCEWMRITGAQWLGAARAQGIALQLSAPDEQVWIEADPLLLESLLGNLIDNALRHAGGARVIRLQVGDHPPSLTVEDDGSGIPASEAEHVFEAFYRAPGAGAEGSGLGLAIVCEIARAHGAWWRLETRPVFEGMRVAVVFPGTRRGVMQRRHDRPAAPEAPQG